VFYELTMGTTRPTAVPDDATDASLNERQQRFVLEYVACLCATQAAVRAGYSRSSARQIATRLMSKASIQAAISAEKEKYARLVGLETYQVLSELKAVAFSDVTKFRVDPRTGEVTADPDLSPLATKAIQSVDRRMRWSQDGKPRWDINIKLWPKVEALKLLAQIVGLIGSDKVAATDAPGVLIL
jgi:phage terminase small subunit